MAIKIAYDISFLAWFFDRPGAQSGVYRTVEELFFGLCERRDIELIAVAASGDNSLLDVSNSSRYLNLHNELACRFEPALAGRFGLCNLYLRTFGRLPSQTGDSSASSWMLNKITQKFTQIVTHSIGTLDRARVFLDGNFDLFHSPFLRLPPRDVVPEIPRLLTVYDLIFLKSPDFMTAELVTFLQRIFDSVDLQNDWVACISEFTKQEFCDFTGMSPERVFVTPLAAADHFRPVSDGERILGARRKYGIPPGDYFLALSALQPRKNFAHLIHCFLRLLSEHPYPDLHLVIVGTPAWLYEEIFAEGGSSSEFRSRIIFTGFVSNQDLSAVYSGALAFVFPSLYEGFGLPPLEAMQCGVPVITSNTTALPEVVGDSALLVDPQDADALCQAMLDLLTHEELRRELSSKGLLRSNRFSWAASAQANIEAYKTISGAARSAPVEKTIE